MEYGADVNDRDGDGRTPLIIACERSLGSDIISILLQYGAERDAQDLCGRDGLSYARRNRDKRTIDLLTSLDVFKNDVTDNNDDISKDSEASRPSLLPIISTTNNPFHRQLNSDRTTCEKLDPVDCFDNLFESLPINSSRTGDSTAFNKKLFRLPLAPSSSKYVHNSQTCNDDENQNDQHSQQEQQHHHQHQHQQQHQQQSYFRRCFSDNSRIGAMIRSAKLANSTNSQEMEPLKFAGKFSAVFTDQSDIADTAQAVELKIRKQGKNYCISLPDNPVCCDDDVKAAQTITGCKTKPVAEERADNNVTTSMETTVREVSAVPRPRFISLRGDSADSGDGVISANKNVVQHQSMSSSSSLLSQKRDKRSSSAKSSFLPKLWATFGRKSSDDQDSPDSWPLISRKPFRR